MNYSINVSFASYEAIFQYESWYSLCSSTIRSRPEPPTIYSLPREGSPTTNLCSYIIIVLSRWYPSRTTAFTNTLRLSLLFTLLQILLLLPLLFFFLLLLLLLLPLNFLLLLSFLLLFLLLLPLYSILFLLLFPLLLFLLSLFFLLLLSLLIPQSTSFLIFTLLIRFMIIDRLTILFFLLDLLGFLWIHLLSTRLLSNLYIILVHNYTSVVVANLSCSILSYASLSLFYSILANFSNLVYLI